MKRVLVLGATGRSGSAVISHLSGRVEIVAGLRTDVDRSRLPGDAGITGTALVDLASIATLQRAIRGMNVVVNAIRLREDIPATALVDLHRLILGAAPGAHPPLVVTVGGAGSLHLPGQRRFWQSPAFPARTLPRGRAHAELRDHLEAGTAGGHWAYLIPPPAFVPEGQATGSYRVWRPSEDESEFTRRSIGYADFALALADAVEQNWTGTCLVGT